MELNEARSLVCSRFALGWAPANQELCPYVLDNETGPSVATWARCSVRSMPSGQSTLGTQGNRKFHRRAMIRVELYGPPAKGLAGLDTLVKAAKDLFEAASFSGIKTYDADMAEIGLVEDDRWFLSTVEVDFEYEEIR